jgi:hypothetical protein
VIGEGLARAGADAQAATRAVDGVDLNRVGNTDGVVWAGIKAGAAGVWTAADDEAAVGDVVRRYLYGAEHHSEQVV